MVVGELVVEDRDVYKRQLEQAVAVPLFTQQKRLLLANGIKGLVFDPFGRCWM